MKKFINKYSFFGFIFGGIIFGSISAYAATVLSSSSVNYSNTNSKMSATNVQSAIDELHDKANYGNASSDTILKGKSALVSGKKITGSMNNYSNDFVWINTDNGTFSNNINYTYSDGRVTNQMVGFLSNTRKGYFDGSTKFIFGEKNDIASYIKSGTKFLGVDGTYTNDATATANDIVKGKTAYVKGTKITGNRDGGFSLIPGLDNCFNIMKNYVDSGKEWYGASWLGKVLFMTKGQTINTGASGAYAYHTVQNGEYSAYGTYNSSGVVSYSNYAQQLVANKVGAALMQLKSGNGDCEPYFVIVIVYK